MEICFLLELKIFDKQKLEKYPEKSDFIMEYMNKNSVQRASPVATINFPADFTVFIILIK